MNHSIENAYNATVNIKAHRDMINKQAHINNATNSTFTQNDTHNHITTVNVINPIITNEYNRNDVTFNPNNNQNTNINDDEQSRYTNRNLFNDKNIIPTNKTEQKCASRDSDVENGVEIDKVSTLEDFVRILLKFAPKQTMLISELGRKIKDEFDQSIKQLSGLTSVEFFNGMNEKKIIQIKTEKINIFVLTFAQYISTKSDKFERNGGVTSNDLNTNMIVAHDASGSHSNVNHKKRPRQLIINDDDEIEDDVHETPKKKRKVNRNHCKPSNKNKPKHQLKESETDANSQFSPGIQSPDK